jgi:hypothetical protein
LINAKDIGDMREAKGIVWVTSDMIKLPDEMAVIFEAAKEQTNVA